MRFHRSISGKLIVFVVGLLLVQGCLTIAWISHQMHRELIARELDALDHDVALASLDLSLDIGEASRQTLALVDVPPIQGIIRARANNGVDPLDGSTELQWRRRLESIFRSTLSANPEFLQLRYIGTAEDGLEIVRADRAATGGPIRIVPHGDLQPKGSRDYFQSALAMQADSVYLSRIELNREFGEIAVPHRPVIRAATPVYDGEGVLFGAIVLNLDMGEAFARAGRNVPAGRSLFVANRDGDFVVHPDPSRTFGFDLGQRHRIADDFPAFAGGFMSNDEPLRATGVTRTSDGARAAVAHRTQSIDLSDPSRALFLLLTTEYDALAAGPNALLRSTALGAFGFLAIAGAFGTIVARRFTTPIRSLSRTASLIARGNLDARSSIRAGDELGDLSLAFNQMAESLQQQQEALEDRAAGLETRMAAIVKTAVDAIITTDKDGIVESCNPAIEGVFGYEPAEIIGKPINSIIPSIQTLARRGNQNREVFGRRPDGSQFPIDLAVNEVVLEDQVLFTGIARDISDTRRVHEVLREAKEAADAANVAKSDFLAVMSHELRTPLNGVIGMTELLLGTDLDERQRHHATLAKLSADTLLSLINDILDFSKIEAGKVELEELDFDLRQAIEAVATSLAPRAEEKGIELVAFVDPRLNPLRCGDPGRIQQILLNLASNSIKFTETGEVVIEVRPDGHGDDNPRIKVSIHDTGIGIPPDRTKALFNRFAQIDASTTRKFGGTGLGLAICKHLVELMDGEIGVESTPGEGSTFWFTCSIQCRSADESAGEAPDFAGCRVLVIDDNETNRKLLCEHLSVLGIPHAAAAGPEAALRSLSENARAGSPFTVAFVDMNMPGMNGVELAHSIMADPSIADVALILLGSSTTMDTRSLSAAGFRCWLAKPIRQTQVTEYILRAIAEADAPHQPVSTPSATVREGTDLEGVVVLVAEDDAISREVVSCLLDEAGCIYTTAPNGRIALDEALRGRFDLALLDCQMPEMDGFETVRRIRAHEASAGGLSRLGTQLPIAALTANAVKGDRERCIAAGMDDYLAKPLTTKRLYDMIRILLALNAGNDAQPAPESVKSDNDGPVLDLDELLGRWQGMDDLVHRVLARFETQAPEALAEIEAAVAAADAERTRELAHTLKGAAAYAGAGRVRNIAATLERLGEQGRLDAAEAEIEMLRSEIERCVEALPKAHRRVDAAVGDRPAE